MKILCFGDSNTRGYIPNRGWEQSDHYPAEKCWPGLLQQTLGSDYVVVADGADSRATTVDVDERNGKTSLPPSLKQNAPIDLVVLALGGNDLKAYFNRTAEQIRDGLAELVDIIQPDSGPEHLAPDILILSLPVPSTEVEKYQDESGIFVFKNAVGRAHQLTSLYEKLADQENCHFLNISDQVVPSELDGAHLDEAGHAVLAKLVYDKVVAIFTARNSIGMQLYK